MGLSGAGQGSESQAGTWKGYAMRRHRALAVAVLVAGALVAASGSAMAETGVRPPSAPAAAITARLGAARSLAADYLGTNFDYGGASQYGASDPKFYGQLAALQPGTLRYPGGTNANFFQWQAGLPVDPPAGKCVSSSTSSAFRFTLSDLLTAYNATKAPPIFDLNVMTSTLSCQVKMLQRAQQLGLPIRYVELGNEFYLDFDNYPTYFPTAADYGRTVASYVKAVHKDFRGAQVAAVGSLGVSTAREQTWNQHMLDAARQAGGLPDAITLHVYPFDNTALTTSALPDLFTEPYASLTSISSAVGKLPVARPTWLTEYNLRPKHTPNSNPAQTTYAQALFVAEMNLLLTEHVPSAQLIDFWAAFGSNASYSYAGQASNPPLTPGGLAQQLVDEAGHGATLTRPIVFTGAPALKAGGSPALIGQSFTSSPARREVLVNLSPRALTIKTGAAIPLGQAYEQVTYSGSPASQVTTASALTVKRATTGSSLSMPAYSIILVNAPAASPVTPVREALH